MARRVRPGAVRAHTTGASRRPTTCQPLTAQRSASRIARRARTPQCCARMAPRPRSPGEAHAPTMVGLRKTRWMLGARPAQISRRAHNQIARRPRIARILTPLLPAVRHPPVARRPRSTPEIGRPHAAGTTRSRTALITPGRARATAASPRGCRNHRKLVITSADHLCGVGVGVRVGVATLGFPVFLGHLADHRRQHRHNSMQELVARRDSKRGLVSAARPLGCEDSPYPYAHVGLRAGH